MSHTKTSTLPAFNMLVNGYQKDPRWPLMKITNLYEFMSLSAIKHSNCLTKPAHSQ